MCDFWSMELKNIFNRLAELLHFSRSKVDDGCSGGDVVIELESQLSHLKAAVQRLPVNADSDMAGDIGEVRRLITEIERTVRLMHRRDVVKHAGSPVECGVEITCDKVSDNKAASEYIGRIDKIIAENIHDVNFGVDTVVSKMLVSRTLLYTRFKEFSGQSIGSYIADYRLRKAKEMLADGDVPVNSIASRLGFSNQRYFSTFFKDKTGKSPTEYRRELQNLMVL